jgi:class 3 adenylate cyclase/tetratricopeptide (TPR) repeat protein
MSLVCSSCGAQNPTGARFCNSCGAAVAAAAPSSEERKLVSVFFVDLVGFTTRADGADPEDVRDVLELYHADARSRIESYGGVVEKFVGDAVMAVFGAPIAHGDDAERAVRAALSVLDGIGELNEAHALDLAARAAVNTGEAVVSIGSGPGEALATGDVVNTASRLQQAAPPGRVIVGSATYRATRQVIPYEALAPVDAKGKGEPVEAWLAREPSRAPAERPFSSRELVGRDEELQLLRSLWTRACREHRPHLLTIVGPPGIGKSRLTRELASLVTADGGRVLRGRCLPYGGQAGYQAFSFLVRDACGIVASDPPDVAREKLERVVGDVMPADERADTARYLALLLGLAPDDAVPALSLLFFAARRFVERVGLVQPTLLVLEDVHWAQASELELLEYLAQHLRESPLLLVALTRPELLDSRPAWGSGLAAQTTIPLEPLEPVEAAALAANVVREANERGFDVTRLVETAGGNPLFVEELAASVVELGEGDDLPVTVREAIAARIDALPSAARTALLAAAVVGRTFWRGVVRAAGTGDDVDEALRILELRDLVRHDPLSQLAGDVQFTFKHMLIREVAYGTLPRATRRERHAVVARLLEDALGESPETLSSILAYHWSESDEPTRAVHYLLVAADKARRGWAKSAAIDLYSKALELAEGDELRRRIQLQRGQALVELLDYSNAVEELETLAPELSGSDKLEALIWLGIADVWMERDAAVIATADEALPLAEKLGDESGIAAALAMKSHGLAQRGAEGDLDHAIELGDRAVEQWPVGARAFELANHLHLHADAKYWVGDYAQSAQLSRATRLQAREVHSPEALLRGGAFEALALAGLGRHEEAISIWEDLLSIAHELDHPPRTVLNNSSLAYRELLDLDEAQRRSEQVIELTAAQSIGMNRQFATTDLLLTRLLAGDIGGAQAMWPALWESAQQATAWTTWLIAGRLEAARAEIALHAETPDVAAEWADRAVATARRTRRRKYEALSLALLGEALGRLGHRDQAFEALRGAVAIADDLVGPPLRWRTRAMLGSAAYATGDDDSAATVFSEAAELIDTFAATLAPERSARLLSAPIVDEILSAGSR